jgi:hypothetical protein
MKAALKSAVSTISILAVVTLMSACGSKKSAPLESKEPPAAPAAPAPAVVASKAVSRNYTAVSLTCSKGTAIKPGTEPFVGTVLELKEDGSYSITPPGSTTSATGKFTTAKDEKKEKNDSLTLIADGAKETETKIFDMISEGEDLTISNIDENETFCPKTESTVRKFKRNPEQPAATATAAPGADTPAPTGDAPAPAADPNDNNGPE